jgi:hypothetical protein
MARRVFISYARTSSLPQATALAERLGDEAFLDTNEIADGEEFPSGLIEALLDARVVVVFATRAYVSRRYCLLELRIALTVIPSASIVIALGEGAEELLELLPPEVAVRNWPPAAETERLASLVRGQLDSSSGTIRAPLAPHYARRLASSFLEETLLPAPKPLPVATALPTGIAERSIGARFVGRADVLRGLHRSLSEGRSGAARVTGRIAAGGGFGKTQLAVEYLHRYADCYPGGVFWIDAAANDLNYQFWRVLRCLDSDVPDLPTFRKKNRDLRLELGAALQRLSQPALCVIDNIPEAGPGESPRLLSAFFPSPPGGCVTVLATSRQETQEPGVRSFCLDVLARDSAVLLLTDNLVGAADLDWAEWETLAAWVGDLPLALDLLNRVLFLRSVSPRRLLEQAVASGPTEILDAQRNILRGQVPEGAIRGISEALQLSVDRLDPPARWLALILALLPAAPIPEVLVDTLFDVLTDLHDGRATLRSRHFVTGGSGLVFGRMHSVLADFLRSLIPRGLADKLAKAPSSALSRIMTAERCADPNHWPLMNLCRVHAEVLFDRATATGHPLGLSLGDVAAMLRAEQGDIAGARELLERAFAAKSRHLGSDHSDTASSENNLVTFLIDQGDLPAARQRQEHVVRTMTRLHGDEHPRTTAANSTLAQILWHVGDFAAARALQEKIVGISKRVDGEDHPRTLTFEHSLTLTLAAQGDHDGAHRIGVRIAATLHRVLGEEHPQTLAAKSNLASTARVLGDLATARKLAEQVLAVRTRVLGEEHPDTVLAMDLVAGILREMNELSGLREMHERIVSTCRRVFGEEHRHTVAAKDNFALTLARIDDLPGALGLHREVLALDRRLYGPDHAETLSSMCKLAMTLLRMRDAPGAIDLLITATQSSKRVLGDQHPLTLARKETLAAILAIGKQG